MPLPLHVARRFLNPVFIETGTYHGEGVQTALQAGYGKVVSIELEPALYREAMSRFISVPAVILMLGSSPIVLKSLVTISGRVTFWLDAHYHGTGTTSDHDIPEYPVVQELEAIRESGFEVGAVLVDDFRLLPMDIIQATLSVLHKINPKFTVELVEGCQPYDIIAAYL